MLPALLSLNRPFFTCPELLVAVSFHLYDFGASAGTAAQPGLLVGAASMRMHWQSVALNTATAAPPVTGSSVIPPPAVKSRSSSLMDSLIDRAAGLLLFVLICSEILSCRPVPTITSAARATAPEHAIPTTSTTMGRRTAGVVRAHGRVAARTPGPCARVSTRGRCRPSARDARFGVTRGRRSLRLRRDATGDPSPGAAPSP